MKKISILICLCILVLGIGFFAETTKAGFFDFLFGGKEALNRLKVSGREMFFEQKPVLLRGVAVGDPHSRQVIDDRTITDYEMISKEWKANVVRLSVHPGVYRMDEEKGKKILEEEVAAARDQGLFVIIDWHVIGFPNGWYKPCKFGEDHYYSYSSNFNTARNFWKYAAIQFRGDNGVMFELWNEPADNKDQAWSKIKPYMERLYDVIRSNGAENVVIAPGVWWTYDMRGIKGDPLKGDNIAYAWHNYPQDGRYLKWSEALDNLQEKYPIFVTEWGFETEEGTIYYDKDKTYYTAFKKFLAEKNLHFTAWCWHSIWKPRMFEANWLDLSEFGKEIKNLLSEISQNNGNYKKEQVQAVTVSYNANSTKYIENGLGDANSIKLGRGERIAVVNSYKLAFGKEPQNQSEMNDLIKIANGYVPTAKSDSAEAKANINFQFVYKRQADMNNKFDNNAVMIMAYGLRQRAGNRNLKSEKAGLNTFKSVYLRLPANTKDWNVMQAITYSGAKR